MTAARTSAETEARPNDDKETVTAAVGRTALLDDEGELSDAFVRALSHVFLRFSSHARRTMAERMRSNDTAVRHDDVAATIGVIAKCVLAHDELDAFARAVNDGAVMSDAEKDELREYFDVDDGGRLTFTGFCEMYHLQSGGSEDETWKDLRALGFNDQLERPKKPSA